MWPFLKSIFGLSSLKSTFYVLLCWTYFLTSVPSLRLSSCRCTAKRSPAWYSSEVIFRAPSKADSTCELSLVLCQFWGFFTATTACSVVVLAFHLTISPHLQMTDWLLFQTHNYLHHNLNHKSNLHVVLLPPDLQASLSGGFGLLLRPCSPTNLLSWLVNTVTSSMVRMTMLMITSFPRSSVVATIVCSEDCLRTTLDIFVCFCHCPPNHQHLRKSWKSYLGEEVDVTEASCCCCWLRTIFPPTRRTWMLSDIIDTLEHQ